MINVESCSPHTLRAYERELQLFQAELEGLYRKNFPRELAHVEEALIKAAKSTMLKSAALAASSRQRRLAAIKSFLRFLLAEKVIERPLGLLLQGPKVPRRLTNYLSVDECLSVLNSLLKPEACPQTRVLFFLLYGAGLRVSEACALEWNQIQWEQRTLSIVGKGKKHRILAAPVRTFELLESYKKSQGKTLADSIWGNKGLSSRKAYEMIRSAGARAGLTRPIHPHLLRHSFATHLLVSGASLRVIQSLLGHQSLAATEKYTHLTIDELARTLEKHSPLKMKHLQET